MKHIFQQRTLCMGLCLTLCFASGCKQVNQDRPAGQSPATAGIESAAESEALVEAQSPKPAPEPREVSDQTPPPLPPPNPLAPPQVTGEVLFSSGFDSEPIGDGARLNLLDHPPFRAEYIALGTEAEPDHALILAGSDAPRHDWKPALEFRYATQSDGRLKIGFDFFQASYDAGTLNLQVVDLRNGFKVHQRIRIANDFIEGPGSTNRLFKESITAGYEARWQRVEWILPLPGGADSEMSLRFDGQTESNMRHKHNAEGAVNALRMFLHLRRNADIVYYIDNVLIEKLP